MHRPFSSHARFFSSLDQVESRLESEKPLPIESNPSPLTSSPLFLDYPNPDSAQTEQSSGAAVDFFSAAQGEEEGEEDGEEDEDEIERLVSLLGLSMEESCGGCSFDGFYSKMAGVKGPKCEEERRRLDGWIGCYYYGRHRRREPARLAHLLLGKAACCLEEDGGDGDGVGGIGFPGTVEEFLEHDPPPLMEEEE